VGARLALDGDRVAADRVASVKISANEMITFVAAFEEELACWYVTPRSFSVFMATRAIPVSLKRPCAKPVPLDPPKPSRHPTKEEAERFMRRQALEAAIEKL